MNTRTLGLAITLSALLSGWMSVSSADDAGVNERLPANELEAFKNKIENMELSYSEARALTEIKKALLNSEARSSIQPSSEATVDDMDFVNRALGTISDDELMEAVIINRKRNLQPAGDYARIIESDRILELADEIHKPHTYIDFDDRILPYPTDLTRLIDSDFQKHKLKTLKIKPDRLPDDPEKLTLTFTNTSDNLSFTQILMDFNIRAEGTDNSLYAERYVKHDFLPSLKPGEERREIFACGTDCQKAMAHNGTYVSFTVNEVYARVNGSNRLLHLENNEWKTKSEIKYLTEHGKKNERYRKETLKNAAKLENMLKTVEDLTDNTEKIKYMLKKGAEVTDNTNPQ